MASTIVRIPIGLTGLTDWTASLYTATKDSSAASGPSTLTEDASADGDYYITVTEALTGVHRVIVYDGDGVVRGGGWTDPLNDDSATYDTGVLSPAVPEAVVTLLMRLTDDRASYLDSIPTILTDTAEIGTAGAGLTALGDTRIANLDATVSSRLADADYTAPANSSIASILADTNELQTDWADGGRLDLILDSAASFAASILSTLSTKLAGITSLAKWLGILAGKTADAGTLAEINATTAGAGYDNSTDSQEAIRDRGDAAWTTGGSSTLTQQQVRDALKLAPTAGSPAAGSTDAEMDSVLAKLNAKTISVSSEVAGNGDFDLYRGVDYSADLGNQKDIAVSGFADSAFSGATGTFSYQQAGGAAVTTAGTVTVSQSGSTVTASLGLTHTETTAMVAGLSTTYEITITTTGSLVLKISGRINVKDQVS